ncbi:isopenicillin N synthase family oxygenase [Microbacterium sp. 18062]|uniref:isopenicillin N synthase family dioxygenase n=1 Tax=Microbacterium sp. 18062 TaxID=2681410 RepID=UPI001358F78A|nr:2-oxoglutarate and iron-dependent oxygenase domain-containing protein [Microbacterium sp. 18062]
MVSGFEVPTVDISAYVHEGSPGARRRVAEQIDDACRTVGFIQIVGHGVPAAVTTGIANAIDGFFEQPLETKKEYMRPKRENRGYTPPKTESLSYTIGIDPITRMNDFFEAYNVGVTRADFPDAELPVEEYPDNTWPVEPAGFRPQVEAYFAQARRVARTLTDIFADALGVGRDFFEPFTRHSLDVLRMNNYALPPGSIELGAEMTGMGEHTDFGVVTVLWADQVAGLQVLGRDGLWHDVQPADDAFLVNLGDVMARVTNDQWMSTLHRVKPPIIDGTIVRRRSAAFFEDGDPAALVQPLASFVPEGDEPLYAPVTLKEHITAKLEGLKSLKKNLNAEREAARVTTAVGA